eukprot:616059-Amphidinium_carterae.1
MIDTLVMRMPQQSREQFDHFFLQLSLIASTTTRLRSSLGKCCLLSMSSPTDKKFLGPSTA